MSVGMQIACTGLVVYLVCAVLMQAVKGSWSKPWLDLLSVSTLAGFVAIPVGLLIAIWS